MGRFDGKVAVVTGSSRGLGRSIASAFAQEGAFVWVHYQKREEDARETLSQIEAEGGKGGIFGVDVQDGAAVQKTFAELVEKQGPIDILVNNAGICRDQFFVMMDDQDWQDVLSVNLGGVYHCSRAVARSMISRKSGVILHVASVSGLHASPGQANYAASKGAILSLTRTMAAELAPKGVRVNAIVPGLINAGMAVRMDQRIARQKREMIPLKRFGEAEEVARVAVFLASEDASYVVGQALVIDGGLTL
ncbi:MAG: 3-oxoacyl-ACP reductase FabG [Myxococcales bacterium]|nr:3-oxoacyl-ACP reductase FabG [Myxococcales bacterium]